MLRKFLSFLFCNGYSCQISKAFYFIYCNSRHLFAPPTFFSVYLSSKLFIIKLILSKKNSITLSIIAEQTMPSQLMRPFRLCQAFLGTLFTSVFQALYFCTLFGYLPRECLRLVPRHFKLRSKTKNLT